VQVAVIIPNWNGKEHLTTCLGALRQQTYSNYEVVVVDNGSTDGSLELMATQFPEARVISLSTNRGFSAAINEGILQTDSEIVAILNNDTEAEPQWLSEMCRVFVDQPGIDFCASKLLLFDRRDIIHSAGDFYGTDGVPGNRGVWERDSEKYSKEEPVFGACGGAAAYRRAMLREIGLFDEELVAYCEDVDLNWRAQLAGHRCMFVPSARVYHKLSATGAGPLASYFVGRNMILVLAKDMPGPIIGRHWVSIFFAQVRFAVHSILHFREPAARARLAGQAASLRYLPKFLTKRSLVQRSRKVRNNYLESILG
jgi:GT2 family glycosyltransferase